MYLLIKKQTLKGLLKIIGWYSKYIILSSVINTTSYTHFLQLEKPLNVFSPKFHSHKYTQKSQPCMAWPHLRLVAVSHRPRPGKTMWWLCCTVWGLVFELDADTLKRLTTRQPTHLTCEVAAGLYPFLIPSTKHSADQHSFDNPWEDTACEARRAAESQTQGAPFCQREATALRWDDSKTLRKIEHT